MRIISGIARGTILTTLNGEETRPTLERVKENFFNAINFDAAGAKVLDLFAGSGQLGLEALSRGAREAVFVDADPECVKIIERNAKKAKLYEKCEILKCDYARYLSGLKQRVNFEKFDIVFIDPPYEPEKKLIKDSVNMLLQNGFVSDGGLLICESGDGEKFYPGENNITKVYKYGKIYITIIRITEVKNER